MTKDLPKSANPFFKPELSRYDKNTRQIVLTVGRHIEYVRTPDKKVKVDRNCGQRMADLAFLG